MNPATGPHRAPPVTYLPPRDRRLSMVFQSYAVFLHKRVRDNIGFGLSMRGAPKDRIRQRVAWAADLLHLTEYLDRYPAQLSGGQRQRVAVARAILAEADVLLMDEPLSNLDALLRLSFRAELKKLVTELGTTTLYVTHDQVEALSLGSPPMNFLSGTVSADPLRLDLDGAALPVPDTLAPYAGRPVRLGIRAEAIQLSEVDDPDAVPATVQVFEPLGSAVLLTVELAGQQVKLQAPARYRAEPGQRVGLRTAAESQRWFDPETALALDIAGRTG